MSALLFADCVAHTASMPGSIQQSAQGEVHHQQAPHNVLKHLVNPASTVLPVLFRLQREPLLRVQELEKRRSWKRRTRKRAQKRVRLRIEICRRGEEAATCVHLCHQCSVYVCSDDNMRWNGSMQ
jgi:hypothetical protein